MSSAAITIQGLSKSYGKVRALDELALTIESGPVGLLGPNGSGKTTLLKLLLGLLSPDAGTARIAGMDPFTPAGRLALRRFVGYMPEGDCLIPGMSAVELVSTLARLSGVSKDDAMTRAHEVLDYVGLDESRYRECDGYSTGMKQRLKLAQALVHDPPILLLDEPTNGLDPKGRRHMLDLVHDLGHAQSKTLLLCSHLLPDVERCCRDVVVLQRGRVVAEGSIAALTMAEGHRVRAVVLGDPAPLCASLAALAIPCEPSRSIGQPAGEGPHEIVAVLQSADCDVLFTAAARAGVSLLSVEPVRSSLEDVFVATLATARNEESA